jgi:hypothetical protein
LKNVRIVKKNKTGKQKKQESEAYHNRPRNQNWKNAKIYKKERLKKSGRRKKGVRTVEK